MSFRSTNAGAGVDLCHMNLRFTALWLAAASLVWAESPQVPSLTPESLRAVLDDPNGGPGTGGKRRARPARRQSIVLFPDPRRARHSCTWGFKFESVQFQSADGTALETLVALEDAENTHYIVKWNPRKSDTIAWRDKVFAEGPVKTPREGKRVVTIVVEERKEVNNTPYTFNRVVRVTERTIDKQGQFLLAPEITLEGWWTDLAMDVEDVIELYRQHATSEQFHSEFKTDLDLERLPSGKFATNALVMVLGAFAYNILRFIGQTGLIAPFGPVRHSAKRRRLRTVIQELMYLAARLITTGRRLKLRFSRHCPAFTAFSAVYARLVPAG